MLDVYATDADSGQNAYITYSITRGDPMKVFRVETQVKFIYLTKFLGLGLVIIGNIIHSPNKEN